MQEKNPMRASALGFSFLFCRLFNNGNNHFCRFNELFDRHFFIFCMDLLITDSKIDRRDAMTSDYVRVASAAARLQLAWTSDFSCRFFRDFNNLVAVLLFEAWIHDFNFDFCAAAHISSGRFKSSFHFLNLSFHLLRN